MSDDRTNILEKDKPYTLEEIVAEYKDMVYNTALSILQHVEAAEDVAQDVFIKLYEKLDEFREDSSLKTYIYRITANTAIDALRKEKRRKKVYWWSGDAEDKEETAHFDHPGILLDKKEDARHLFEAIKSLPEQQKLAYVLQKIEGQTVAEIAMIMNNKPTAVESLLARAKNNLKKTLTDIIEK